MLLALGVPSTAVLDTVARLVDRSLVVVDDADDGSVRYRLLDSIRAYAAARLREAGQEQVAASAQAGWFEQTAAWCDAHVRSDRQAECVTIARSETGERRRGAGVVQPARPSARHAYRHRFRMDLGRPRRRDSRRGPGPQRHRHRPAGAASARPVALLAGWLEASAGDITRGGRGPRRSGACRPPRTTRSSARTPTGTGPSSRSSRDDRGTCSRSRRPALGDVPTSGLAWQTAGSLVLAAYGALILGDTTSATRDASEAVDLLTPIGDSWGLVHAQAMIGGIAQAEHRFDAASRALAHAVEQSQRLGFTGQAALHLANLARVQQRAGRTDEAADTFDRAVAAALACGDGRLAATTRVNLARLHRAGGDRDAAIALLEQNDHWYRAAGGGDGALLNRCLLRAATRDGPGLEEVLDEARTAGNVEVRVYALDALTCVAVRRGDLARAEDLLSTADTLAATVAHLVDESDRLDRAEAARALSAARTVGDAEP